MDVDMVDEDELDEIWLDDLDLETFWPEDDRPFNTSNTLYDATSGVSQNLTLDLCRGQVGLQDTHPPFPGAPSSVVAASRLEPNQGREPLPQRIRYSGRQRKILQDWLEAHRSYPYIQPDEKQSLSASTGLTERQVANYVSNFRRRYLPRQEVEEVDVGGRPASEDSCLANASIQACMASPVVFDVEEDTTDAASPNGSASRTAPAPEMKKFQNFGRGLLEWYLDGLLVAGCFDASSLQNGLVKHADENGSTETDPPGEQDTIAHQVPNSCMGPPAPQNHRQPHGAKSFDAPFSCEENVAGASTSFHWAEFQQALGPFASNAVEVASVGADLETGTAMDWHSEASAGSLRSRNSYSSLGPRRGRRAYGNTSAGVSFHALTNRQSSNASSRQPFSCEECGQRFATAFTRRRHVETIHSTPSIWVCQPIRWSGQSPLCSFCQESPDTCRHRMSSCWQKSEVERTFYRKDAMIQHYMHAHRCYLRYDDRLLSSLKKSTTTQLDEPPQIVAEHPCSSNVQTAPPVLYHEPKRSEIRLYCKKAFSHFYCNTDRDETDKTFRECFAIAVSQIRDPFFCQKINESLSSSTDLEFSSTENTTSHFQVRLPVGQQLSTRETINVRATYSSSPQETWIRRWTDVAFITVFLRCMSGSHWSGFQNTIIRTTEWELLFERQA